MSLYDGLDIESKEGKKDKKPDVSGWGSRSKLLETQKQIQAQNVKKASSLNLKKKQNIAPVFDLKKRNEDIPLTFNMLTGKMERVQAAAMATAPAPDSQQISAIAIAPFIGTEAPGTFLGVTDEYDPLRPNDYETYSKKRKEQKMKEREQERQKEYEERERRRQERQRDNHSDEDKDEEEDQRRQRSRRREDSDEENRDREDEDFRRRREDRDRDRDRDGDRDGDGDGDREKDRTPARGAAIAPPPSLIEEKVEEPPDDKPTGASSGEYGGGFNVGKGSVVSRMMARMGYRKGQGLGKSEQGMSTALQVEKTSKRGGKIIHERDIPQEPPKMEPPQQQNPNISNVNLLKNPSKVLLLRNMVGPGEVDQGLEPETAEECTKYGKVIKCVIFEIPGTNHEEAVRIFVEFERQESAIKAVVDLNGRFFGGRTVRACFYNLDRFRRLDLADPVE